MKVENSKNAPVNVTAPDTAGIVMSLIGELVMDVVVGIECCTDFRSY